MIFDIPFWNTQNLLLQYLRSVENEWDLFVVMILLSQRVWDDMSVRMSQVFHGMLVARLDMTLVMDSCNPYHN